MMKLLYIHQHFTTPRGAGGSRSYEMARAMVQRGHQVTMVCGSYAGGATGLSGPFIRGRREGQVEGIDIVEFDLPYENSNGYLKRTWTFMRFVLRTIGVALGRKYDVIFTTTTPLTVGLPGILARWLRGKPFVFEVRDLWPELPRAMGVIRNPAVLALMGALEFCSYRSATRLIGISPGIVDGIAKRGVRRERIAMISNGCDLDLFAAATATDPQETDDRRLMVLYAGTHGVANGLDAVIDAAVELKRRNDTAISFMLVGGGSEKARLIAKAEAECLTNIRFVSALPKTELATIFQRADVGLQALANIPAFYYGTSPNKFFDYLAAGLPVLVNYPGWVADLVGGARAGWAVPPGDAVAFADQLELIAAAREELPQFSHRSRELGRDKFDRAKLAAAWCEWVEAAAK